MTDDPLKKYLIEETTESNNIRSSGPYSVLALVRFLVGAAKLCEDALASTKLSDNGDSPLTISLMQWHVLDRLKTHEDETQKKNQKGEIGLSQRALVSAPETAKSSAISTLLQKMEDGDWIERQIPSRSKGRRGGDEDQRLRIVRLTDSGREVWSQVKPAFEAHLQKRLESFSANKIDSIAKMIRKLRIALDLKKSEKQEPARNTSKLKNQ